jgi:hypothetical protein
VLGIIYDVLFLTKYKKIKIIPTWIIVQGYSEDGVRGSFETLYLFTELHGVTCQKAIILIFTADKMSEQTYFILYILQYQRCNYVTS